MVVGSNPIRGAANFICWLYYQGSRMFHQQDAQIQLT